MMKRLVAVALVSVLMIPASSAHAGGLAKLLFVILKSAGKVAVKTGARTAPKVTKAARITVPTATRSAVKSVPDAGRTAARAVPAGESSFGSNVAPALVYWHMQKNRERERQHSSR
jgi:hypothetical protein